ncbi:Glutamate receptor 1 [Amphibalanus amphitrite]|uniref:Glutamate receptor 1 n=1 Tax=Amphibalanus amphitrite TaxID=1232801 RepID=A0A6A4W730_AMPAM|nr:Glutamate receptor 1 [Amphibalanus amphitrite]
MYSVHRTVLHAAFSIPCGKKRPIHLVSDPAVFSSEIAAAVGSSGLPSPVSIAEVAPAELQEEVRSALWRRAMPVLAALPPLPPAAPSTVLLAGPLQHVTAAYRRLAQQPAAGSQQLHWLLAVPADAQRARAALQPVLRESQRALVLACVNASCARLAATSPGWGGVRLLPWPAGGAEPDWRLRQLGGRTLRVLAPMRRKLPPECSSSTISAYRTPQGKKRLCGYLGQVLNIISEKFNFRMKLIRKGGCGKLKSDGTMDGRPQWLLEGRGDLAAGTCTLDVQRSTAVYMGEWFYSDTTSIAVGRPGHHHTDFLVFGVLTDPVWALTAFYIVLFALLLKMAEMIGHAIRGCITQKPQDGNQNRPKSESGNGSSSQPNGHEPGNVHRPVASLVDYIQQSVRMFLGQGDDVTSALPATRLLMIFVYMTTVTLMSIYSGNLTAFFSIRRDAAAIDNLEDLAASPIEPHVTFGQSHYYIFENATTGARGQIWRKMQECEDCVHRSYKTTETIDFVARMVRGERALFQSQRSLLKRADQYLEHTNQSASALCPLHLARQALRRDFYSLMFPHHSPYSALFDRAIRQLRYQGVIESIFAQVAANKCTRTAAPHYEVTSLDWHLLAGAFYVWAAGLAAATVVWVLEWCTGGRCCRPRRRQEQEGEKKGAMCEGETMLEIVNSSSL